MERSKTEKRARYIGLILACLGFGFLAILITVYVGISFGAKAAIGSMMVLMVVQAAVFTAGIFKIRGWRFPPTMEDWRKTTPSQWLYAVAMPFIFWWVWDLIFFK